MAEQLKLEDGNWTFAQPWPGCPFCERPFRRMRLVTVIGISIGVLPRVRIGLHCPCGYNTRPDGRIEHVMKNHFENCGLKFPIDAVKSTVDGFEGSVLP